MKRSGLPLDDPLRGFDGQGKEFGFSGDSLDDVLGDIIESWPIHRSSDHLRLEVAAPFDAGLRLAPGDPVPGCDCSRCAVRELVS